MTEDFNRMLEKMLRTDERGIISSHKGQYFGPSLKKDNEVAYMISIS
jgi:hypothetical protein